MARAVGDELMGMSDRFNAAVERARRTGSLQELFAGGAEAAHELMSISTSILRITGMVIKEAGKTNDATQSAGDSLAAYVNSGRAATDVAGIVHTMTVAWEGLRDVLGPIGEMVRDAIADPGTAATVGQFFAILATGAQVLQTVMTILLALNSASGGLLLVVVGLALAAGKLNLAITKVTAAATTGAASLTKYGAAGTVAARGLGLAAAAGGKLLGALFVLELAHQLFEAFAGDAVNVEALDASIKKLANTGQVAGEMTRLFGADLSDLRDQAAIAASDTWFSNLSRDLEKAIPLAGDLLGLLGSHTFEGTAENFAALDTAIANYGRTTNDVTGTGEMWQKVLLASGMDADKLAKLLPNTSAELARMQTEAHGAADGTAALAERTKLLNAPLQDAVLAGRELIDVFNELNGESIDFGKAQIAAEESLDKVREALKKNGLALNGQKNGFAVGGEKGRANQSAVIAAAEQAAKVADAQLKQTGSVEKAAATYERYINQLRTALALQGASPKQIDALVGAYTQLPPSLTEAGAAVTALNGKLASIPKGTVFRFNGESITDAAGNTLELKNGIEGIPQGKTFRWNGKDLVDGRGKAVALTEAIQQVPKNKTTKLNVPGIDPTTGKVKDLAEQLQGMPDGNAQIRVDAGSAYATIRQVRQSLSNLGGAIAAVPRAGGGVMVPRQYGGVTAAAGGLLQPQIAPPGTLYQWAEPETGGELFLPRRGIDKRRGQELLGVANSWYDMHAVPMAAGGVRAAASGLVNTAPADTNTTKATRLDSAQAYLRTRDAVRSLSEALKENGRSFSLSTVKGRENRGAAYSVIEAAQQAARTKYDETGSVKAADAAYASYVRGLRATLAQHKVNASVIRQLVGLAGRPDYGITAPAKTPANSLGNIGYTKAAIAAASGLDELKDRLSLNTPGIGMGSPEGRENLGNIIGYLETAAAAAQARFEQTKSSKLAGALYEGYVAQLRAALSGAGYSAAVIKSLVSSYGRITLNRNGGAYMAAGGLASLDRAQVYPGTGAPLYGFAEPGTGGELFVPRNGDRQRGRDLLAIGAGWYGQRLVPASGGGGGNSYDHSTHMTVHAITYDPTPAELMTHQRTVDAHNRTGRRY